MMSFRFFFLAVTTCFVGGGLFSEEEYIRDPDSETIIFHEVEDSEPSDEQLPLKSTPPVPAKTQTPESVPSNRLPRKRIPRGEIPRNPIPSNKIPRNRIPRNRIPSNRLPTEETILPQHEYRPR